MKKLLTILFTVMLSAITFGQAYPFDAVIHGGGNSTDKAYDVAVDNNGNQYVSGTFKNTVDFGGGVTITSNGNADAFVAKFDSNGTIVWANSFGGDGYNTDYTDAIAVDDDGNVITASNFGDTIYVGTDTLISTGNWDIAVVKYDASGNYLWAKHAYSKSKKKDFPTDLKIDSEGNYVLTGYYGDNAVDTLVYESLEIESHGERDVFVLKMDSDGNPLWGVTGGGADKEETKALGIDEDDNIYITGFFNSESSVFGTTTLTNVDGSDVFVAKLNSSGEYQWAVSATGTGTDIGYALDIIPQGDDEEPTGQLQKRGASNAPMLIVAGSFSDSLVYNENGDVLESLGKKDMYALGIDSETGATTIGLQFGGTDDDEAKAVNFIPGSNGTWYLSGISKSDMTFPNATITNKGKKDVVVFHMNQENLDWVKNYGGSSDDYLNSAAVGNKGDIYFAGTYKSSTVDFDPFNFGTNGSYDIWLGKMHEKYATVYLACDMSVQINSGAFNTETDSLFVRGSFQTDAGDTANWQGNMFKLDVENNGDNNFYFSNIPVLADSVGKTYEYKFVMNETWETVSNRTFVLEAPTTWVDPVRFNDDDGTVTHSIRFEVDMNVQAENGNFNAATDTVSIAGSMNGWTVKANLMNDDNSDGVYDAIFDLNEGELYEFKYVINSTGWESVPNREYTVGTSDDTYTAYFNNDEGVVRTTISLSFQCNMELEIAAQRFNPATDTLSARGSFNGWSDVTKMTPSTTDPNTYEGVVNYDSFEDDVIFYKFAYTTASGTNWETNPPTNSNNYEHTVTATDITNGYSIVPLRGYNNSTLETVVNQASVIRFIVDMNGAVDGNGVAFSSIENVAIAGANPPLAWPDGGWPDADSTKVIFMVDDGTHGDETAGDNFWTMEVDFPIYSPLDIEYKYGANWGLSSNGGANDNEGGVGSNHHVTLFPEFTYGSAIDVFGTFETKDVDTRVTETGEIPTVYALGQNYPNPFNPSTVIKFSIPNSGLVSLKVFNILGQEVATLVNEMKSVGVYEVSFDASSLTTGMYIYRIQSGEFTSTKKMLLIK